MAEVNFYEETVNSIKNIGKTVEDIMYVTVKDGKYYKPDEFLEVIKGIDYDNGYGSQIICGNLEIVFKDGSYLFRREYDGCECWDYSPVKELDVELESFTKNDTDRLYDSYWCI